MDSDYTQHDVATLYRLLNIHRKNLETLSVQAALFGIAIPLPIVNEMTLQQTSIQKISDELHGRGQKIYQVIHDMTVETLAYELLQSLDLKSQQQLKTLLFSGNKDDALTLDVSKDAIHPNPFVETELHELKKNVQAIQPLREKLGKGIFSIKIGIAALIVGGIISLAPYGLMLFGSEILTPAMKSYVGMIALWEICGGLLIMLRGSYHIITALTHPERVTA
jgi:hypothetical protein